MGTRPPQARARSSSARAAARGTARASSLASGTIICNVHACQVAGLVCRSSTHTEYVREGAIPGCLLCVPVNKVALRCWGARVSRGAAGGREHGAAADPLFRRAGGSAARRSHDRTRAHVGCPIALGAPGDSRDYLGVTFCIPRISERANGTREGIQHTWRDHSVGRGSSAA